MFTDPAFVWDLIGVVLIASEMLIPGFVIFFLGAGALLTAGLTALIPGLAANFALQGVIWAGTSILSLAFLRRRFARIFRGEVHSGEQDEGVGRTATVTETISPDTPGRIRYRGTTWRAVSYTETFQPGDTVQILKEENLTMIVSSPLFPDETEQPSKTQE